MKASAIVLVLGLLGPVAASAQQQSAFKFHGDALVRQEWTEDIWLSAEQTDRQSRRLIRLRPRLEMTTKDMVLAVGAELNYGSDRNTDPEPLTLRDNYESRGARLDLAYARFNLRAFRIQGGRFPMPVGLTEMIWDKDLRPQGGAVGLELGGGPDKPAPFRATGLYAIGSHVFDDEKTQMMLGSATLGFGVGTNSRMNLTGSYIRFANLDSLTPMIRRQNTRFAEAPPPAPSPLPLAYKYEIVDVNALINVEGTMPMQFVADYCWNLAVDQSNRGLWITASVGSIQLSRGRLEYTYATVDRDATLAAYATDDFYWGTGWEGHRADLAFKASNNSSIHGIAQYQRFKDSPIAEERDHWLKRYRIELRVWY